jgi:hypothetical protein
MHYGEIYGTNCWFYLSDGNRSSSWTKANIFKNYIYSNNSTIDVTSSNWSSVSNGDIIQLLSGDSAYHSLIITGIEYRSYGRYEIYVCAHTANRRHVALSAYYPINVATYHHIIGNK